MKNILRLLNIERRLDRLEGLVEKEWISGPLVRQLYERVCRLEKLDSLRQVLEQSSDHSHFKTSQKIMEMWIFLRDFVLFYFLQGRSLQPAETKIKTPIRHARQGKGKLERISFFGQPIDDRTSWVAETEEFRDLIQGFPGSIISCPSDELVIHFRLHHIC